jgi:hypothetical protein
MIPENNQPKTFTVQRFGALNRHGLDGTGV